MNRCANLVIAFLAAALCTTCADPPGYGNLRINIDRQAISTRYSALTFNVAAIELYYDAAGQSIEPGYQLCNYAGGTVISPPESIPVSLDIANAGRTYVGGFPVPAGNLSEIRLFLQEVHVATGSKTQNISTVLKCKGAYGSRTASTQIHSGTKQGEDKDKFAVLRMLPQNRMPIPVIADITTEVTGLFLPARDLSNDPEGSERKLTDTLELVQVSRSQLGVVLPDELVVKFAANVTIDQVRQIVAARATSIQRALRDQNYYTIKLPTGTDLKKEIEYYHNRADVLFVLPNTTLSLMEPAEFSGQRQAPWVQVKADAAWFGGTGSYKPIVAVIDSGFDFSNPDLWPNMYINAKEIPREKYVLVGDRNNNQKNDVLDLDADNDGLITFNDLNALAPMYPKLCQIDRSDPKDKCNPLDLVSGATTVKDRDGFSACKDIVNVPEAERLWQNGIDDDRNGLCDDLIGWNYTNQTNIPSSESSHGTEVAGVIGAVENGAGLVGVTGRVRILPIQATVPVDLKISEFRLLRDLVMHGIDYAGDIHKDGSEHADVINLSAGFIATRNGSSLTTCSGNPEFALETNVDSAKLDEFIKESYKEFKDIQTRSLEQSLLVNGAGNCTAEYNFPDLFGTDAAPGTVSQVSIMAWPSLFNVRGLRVAGSDINDTLWQHSPYGATGTDLLAPAEGFDYVLRSGYSGSGTSLMELARQCLRSDLDPVKACAGTSLGAALVSGAAALVVAYRASSISACDLASQLIRSTDALPLNAPKVVGRVNGRLNVAAARNNVNQYPTLNIDKCRGL